MTARILDGTNFAVAIRQELTDLAAYRKAELGYVPHLAIVVLRDVGGKTASDVYVRQLRRTARSIGILPQVIEMSESTTGQELVTKLDALNANPQIHGIIVQLPLPAHLNRDILLNAILPAKDVDGIGAINAGNLFLNLSARIPATCAAVIELCDRAEIDLDGKRVVIVGASPVVGRPLALLTLHRHATVTICHIYTADLASFTRQADVLVVAVGKIGLITADMVREGAIVIDVGINVDVNGNVCGDVDFAAVAKKASAITPVPGGIGPLTNLMIMKQTLTSLEGKCQVEPRS